MIPFVLFLGYYAVIKYQIEKFKNIVLEWVIKLISFNIVLFILYYFFGSAFLAHIKIKLPIWAMISLAQIVFVLYDVAFSFFIGFYNARIKGKMF